MVAGAIITVGSTLLSLLLYPEKTFSDDVTETDQVEKKLCLEALSTKIASMRIDVFTAIPNYLLGGNIQGLGGKFIMREIVNHFLCSEWQGFKPNNDFPEQDFWENLAGF
jgi:hypothetical protein